MDNAACVKTVFCLGLAVNLGACMTPRYKGPVSDHFDGKVFFNSGALPPKSFSDFLKWQFTKDKKSWHRKEAIPASITVQSPVADMSAQGSFSKGNVTLINHASLLIEINGLNILTDPVWSERTSPVSWAGPKRFVPPGVEFERLPKIDYVLISHNHYDHLDLPTLIRLEKKFAPRFLVPLGDASLLVEAGIEAQRIKEKDWWDAETARPGTDSAESIEFIFVPAAHWSSRGLFDRNMSLWGGWYLKAPSLSVYFAGDTGAGGHFEQIKSRLGAPDLALLPIGAYEPRWFMRDQHMNPEDAVVAHRQVGAYRSIGIHWGTWQLTDEGYMEPVHDLVTAVQSRGLAAGEFIAIENGQSVPLTPREEVAAARDSKTDSSIVSRREIKVLDF